MTRRQITISQALLDYLYGLDGGQANDVLIHSAVIQALGHYVALTEFNEVLELADRAGWIVTVKSKFKGELRSLSDAGTAARQEMR